MSGLRPVLVVGSGGLIGSALMRTLADHAPLALSHAECDLTCPDQILRVMDRLRPRVVFNAAAFTDVDACESETEMAYKINAVGPGHLAQAAREVDCLLIHISSDYVFDGRLDRPYREDDRPWPLSVYGRTKAAGEEAVQAAGGDWLIVRTAWVYSRVKGFPLRILERARQGLPLRVVNDQVGSPTFVEDLAHGLGELMDLQARGVVHLAGGGSATWWDLARRTLDLAGYGEVDLQAIGSADLQQAAKRPRFVPLSTQRFETLTGRPVRPWREALAEALAGFQR